MSEHDQLDLFEVTPEQEPLFGEARPIGEYLDRALGVDRWPAVYQERLRRWREQHQ